MRQFLKAKLDEFDDIAPQKRNAFLHQFELEPFVSRPFCQRIELCRSRNQRCKGKTEGVGALPSPRLARIALAIGAILAEDQTSLNQCSEMPPQCCRRHAM